MCSRFELNHPAREVRTRFHLSEPPILARPGETRPTDMALVIGPRGARLARWGLPVEWETRPLINARAETLASRPTFRPLLAGGRVLVPASWWWEWRVEGKHRIKTRLSPVDGHILALAGLFDGERFVIVTCAASEQIFPLNDRMPVLLGEDAARDWLDPKTPAAAASRGLLPSEMALELTAETPPPAQGDLF
ncbi:hypothetical protein A6A04_13830 [Paramagnetospirillum marisnigri]|uniref:Abasic site processing protein n=1 Tax=Paramagnetospirillum marisnigri TaxID=1285242 RepID=A0A178MTT2_9PROT|nr:SOS response-associated peptidase family protein [Paramagnetospirillum marisnigri]OAN53680.1 hypothetical protein A6A04_13830 [Paramagnetospirillum marisnigri]